MSFTDHHCIHQVLHSISDYRLDLVRGMDKYVEEEVRGGELVRGESLTNEWLVCRFTQF